MQIFVANSFLQGRAFFFKGKRPSFWWTCCWPQYHSNSPSPLMCPEDRLGKGSRRGWCFLGAYTWVRARRVEQVWKKKKKTSLVGSSVLGLTSKPFLSRVCTGRPSTINRVFQIPALLWVAGWPWASHFTSLDFIPWLENVYMHTWLRLQAHSGIRGLGSKFSSATYQNHMTFGQVTQHPCTLVTPPHKMG